VPISISAPDLTGGAYSAPPGLLAGLREPTFKGREGTGNGKGREGRGAWGRGGMRPHPFTPFHKSIFLDTPLATFAVVP